MTEERKQELRQLLNEAMANLEIRRSSGVEFSLLPVEVYRTRLYQSWTSYSDDYLEDLWISNFDPHIVSETINSKLLDFIREEFAPYIHEDRIQSASFFIAVGSSSGYPLDMLLKQLLKIAIVRGIDEAVLAFDRCIKNTHVSFQYMALLEGIRIEAEIQVFEGIKLVPLPPSTSERSRFRYWSDPLEHVLIVKTLLIIDASVFPIFCKPFPELYKEGLQEDNLPFQIEMSGEQFPNFKLDDFYEKFGQVLSLACNSSVQFTSKWRFLPKDELYNLSFGMSREFARLPGRLESVTKVEDTQIEEAKCLYHILVNLDANVREKLRIPIDRWIKSKADQDPVDKMIDLGVAFETLYLSGISETTELSFRFRLHASWHLGKDKEDRNELLTKFRQIYDCRSKAVHRGKLDEQVKFGGERIPISEFIKRAQDLCRGSIIKILEDGQFPDWNSLILGGDLERVSSA